MRFSRVAILFTLVSVAFCGHAEESMFPSATVAKPFMDFDGKGFIVNGQRTYIASGSIHYPRVPKDLWRDRLLRLKRCGFNTVETYAFWNYHEQKENQFDFTGEKDFEGYLKLAQDLGLYAITRVGPYVCAEWDSGGYPIWAKFKPDVIVRKDNPGYMALQDHWLGEILPRVATHQINKGGNVILVQLENEGTVSGAWSGKAPDPYWQSIHDNAIKHGIEVPFFMSGFHHGSVPIVEDPDNSKRLCPWISTEIWAGWYSNYGQEAYSFMRIYRCNIKLLARGGNGHNFYMFHGGSNFDTWNDNEGAASYDYGATLGQAGDLRPVYYRLKANNFFATSFSGILENSSDATAEYQNFASNARVIGARKSPSGTVVFVQGMLTNDEPVVIKSEGSGAGGSFHVPPQEVAPVVLDAPIVSGSESIKIVESAVRILGIARHDHTTTLILQGQPGDTGVLTLALGAANKEIKVGFPSGKPDETFETVGSQTLRILSMSNQLADRTWITGQKNKEYIVVGPEYVGEFAVENGKARLTIERPYTHPAPDKVIVYGPAGTGPQHLAVRADTSIDAAPAPVLSGWSVSLAPECQPGFDDSTWKASEDPLQMGADGDISAFAWYRAAFNANEAGPAAIHFPGAADHLVVFVNGKRCAVTPSVVDPKPVCDELKTGKLSWTVEVDLKSGLNSIAVLATHQGRDKAGGYHGPIDHYYPKGIFQPVYAELSGKKLEIKGWRMRGGLPSPSTLSYQPFTRISSNPAFYKGSFTACRPGLGSNPVFRLVMTGSSGKSVADGLTRGTVFLNNHCVGRYPEKIQRNRQPLPLYLPECWLSASGTNSLVIFDEEGRAPSSDVKIEIETAASREVIAVSEPVDPNPPIRLPDYAPINLRQGAQLHVGLEKPVTASSSAPDCEAANVNDGDDQTSWSPATPPQAGKPAWIQIDLQSPRNLVSCEIFTRYPISFYPCIIEGSADGRMWKTLLDKRKDDSKASDPGNASRTGFPLASADNIRYVRLIIFSVSNPEKPFKLNEFRVWDKYHQL